ARARQVRARAKGVDAAGCGRAHDGQRRRADGYPRSRPDSRGSPRQSRRLQPGNDRGHRDLREAASVSDRHPARRGQWRAGARSEGLDRLTPGTPAPLAGAKSMSGAAVLAALVAAVTALMALPSSAPLLAQAAAGQVT